MVKAITKPQLNKQLAKAKATIGERDSKINTLKKLVNTMGAQAAAHENQIEELLKEPKVLRRTMDGLHEEIQRINNQWLENESKLLTDKQSLQRRFNKLQEGTDQERATVATLTNLLVSLVAAKEQVDDS